MLVIDSYPIAVVLLVVTMLCWGSWANTQKMATREWPFQLFYWDYALGIVLLALVFGLTLGSTGQTGRPMLADLQQAGEGALLSAFVGGVVFNIANLLLVAAIDIAGMSVAFPVGIGIALVLGVIVNYLAEQTGDPFLLGLGLLLVVAAIVLNAVAYRRLPGQSGGASGKGIALSVAAGVLMGFFFRFVAASMSLNFVQPEAGLLTPYSAVLIFALGVFASNFLWNTFFMYRPVKGAPASYSDYFSKGNFKLHAIGVAGGIIWCTGMSFSLIAAEQAGPAISYGLGQGATMVAAAWGVFIWKEFKAAPDKTGMLLALMFLFFTSGLGLIVMAR